MADIDDVLERLIMEAPFRDRLAAEPAAALAGYDLSPADLALLANSIDDAGGMQRGVEQRTSKSAMVGLLASLTGGGGAGSRGGGDCNDTDVAPRSDEERRLSGRPRAGEISVLRHAVGGNEAPPDTVGTRFRDDPYAEDAARSDGHWIKLGDAQSPDAAAPGGGLDEDCDGAVDRVRGGRSVLPDTDGDGIPDFAARASTDVTDEPQDVSDGKTNDVTTGVTTPVPADGDGRARPIGDYDGDGTAEAYKVREAAARTALPTEASAAQSGTGSKWKCATGAAPATPRGLVDGHPPGPDAEQYGSAKIREAAARTASPQEDLVAPPSSGTKHVAAFKWSGARETAPPPEDFLTIENG